MVNGTLGVVFDMDDTLYLERDYVRSGYQAVADAVAVDSIVSSQRAFDLMWHSFESGIRGKNFDHLLTQYPNLRNDWSVPGLVAVYREHQPVIELMDGIESLIRRLRDLGVRVGIVTDGYLATQTRKLDALRLSEIVDHVCMTDQWGGSYWKPHPRGFELVAARLGLGGQNLVYVGDNPGKDFQTPIALGWHSVRLRVAGQLHESVPDRAVGSVAQAMSVAGLADLLIAMAEEGRGTRIGDSGLVERDGGSDATRR